LEVKKFGTSVGILVKETVPTGDYYWIDRSNDGGKTWDLQYYRVQGGEWFYISQMPSQSSLFRVNGKVE
jgi:hypothetical protein